MFSLRGSRSFARSFKHVRLSFGSESRNALMTGIKLMSDATVQTYGPGGRNVAMDYDGGDPKITKDGVTVAKSINFADREQEMGAKLMKRVANNANQYSGDGTTLSTFFAAELLDQGVKAVEMGAHPIMLKRGMERSKEQLMAILDSM